MREFLAIPLPEPLRRDAAELSRALPLPLDRWRFVREEGLHVTVRFLGEVDPATHSRFDVAWQEAASGVGPMTLRVGAAAVAPSARRPRLVWLPVCDETPDGSWRPWPAASSARREPAASFPSSARSKGTSRWLAPGAAGAFPRSSSRRPPASAASSPIRLVLYRSRLGASGATYEELASYDFDAGRPS